MAGRIRRSRQALVATVAMALVLGASLVSTPGAGAAGARPAKPSTSPLAAPASAPSGLAALATDRAPGCTSRRTRPAIAVYLGSTPRELALRLTPVEGGAVRLPSTAKSLAELQLKGIYQSLVAKKIITSKQTLTVQTWPIRDDRGRIAWAYARWRVERVEPMALDQPGRHPEHRPEHVRAALRSTPLSPPSSMRSSAWPDDYGYNIVPAFGDSIWVRRNADRGSPSRSRPGSRTRSSPPTPSAATWRTAWRSSPPPARLNGVPITYQLNVRGAR